MRLSNTKLSKPSLLAAAVLLSVFAANRVPQAEAAKSVVRAVLFSSPTCPHCTHVREQVLPPIAEKYGSQLQVIIVSTATQSGNELFLSACMQYGNTRLSVPLLAIGSIALIGSDEIQQRFPDLIDKNLAAGGMDWPAIPGINDLLAAIPESSKPAPREEPLKAEASKATTPREAADTGSTAKTTTVPTPTAPKVTSSSLPSSAPLTSESAGRIGSSEENTAASPALPSPALSASPAAQDSSTTQAAEPSGVIDLTGDESAGVIDKIRRDIYGNGLAIVVLAGMIIIVAVSLLKFRKPASLEPSEKPSLLDGLTPVLVLAGVAVAAYLSHVELREVEAVCGPVGDCNTVQQSQYARLFGMLPIGILGLLGFFAILAAWVLRLASTGRKSLWATAGIFIMTAFGLLFSIYLTFLEPFVIGATCLWCLSSAIIMTALYVLWFKPGRAALTELAGRESVSGSR